MNEHDEVEVYYGPRPIWPAALLGLAIAAVMLAVLLVQCTTGPAGPSSVPVTTVPPVTHAPARLYTKPLPMGYELPTTLPPMRSAIEAGVRSAKASFGG